MTNDRERNHDRLETEIALERASALRRIGGTLEAILEDLRALDGEIEALDGAERDARIARFDELVGLAETWRWYLVVTREAMGAPGESEIDKAYPIPERKGHLEG